MKTQPFRRFEIGATPRSAHTCLCRRRFYYEKTPTRNRCVFTAFSVFRYKISKKVLLFYMEWYIIKLRSL